MNLRRTIATLLAALMLLALTACGAGTTSPAQDANDPAEETAPSTTESSQFRVGMECAYAPSNWQESAATDTNVPVENVAGAYAEGYDVQIARILADQLDHCAVFSCICRTLYSPLDLCRVLGDLYPLDKLCGNDLLFFKAQFGKDKLIRYGRSRFLALARCKDLLALFLKAGKRTLKVCTV